MSPVSRHAPSRGRAALAAVFLLALALVFAACGENDDRSAASDADPAALAPADSAMYAEVLLAPDGDVEEGIVTAARRVSLLDDPFAELRRALDDEVDDNGERDVYTRRIAPWLGDRAGVFVLPAPGDPEFEDPDVGAAIAVRDRDAAQDMVRYLLDTSDTATSDTYDGVEYHVDDGTAIALIDEYLFAGTPAALRAAVDASRADALADSQRYDAAVDRVADDAIAFAYVDPEPLLPALSASADMTDPSITRLLDQARDAGPVTLSLTASADEVALEVAGDEASIPEADDAGGEVSIDDLPGDAWAVLATPPLGAAIRQAIVQSGEYDTAARQLRAVAGLDLERDVLGWLGGVAAFVRGTAPLELGGGVVIGSDDEAASRRLVGRLEQIVGMLGLPIRPAGGGTGFEVTVPDSPQPIVVLAQGDRVAIGFGGPSARDALDPDESFADSEAGRAVLDTLGDGYEPSFALVPGPLLQLLRAVGAASDPDVQEAMPYLTAYRSIAAGTKREDGDVTVRIVAGLQDPTP